MRPSRDGRIRASQGGLSRNKVAVEESAAGSPPNERDQATVPGPPTFAVRGRSRSRIAVVGSADCWPVRAHKTYPRRISLRGGWVQLPAGPYPVVRFEPCPLSVGRRSNLARKTSALSRASADRKGRDATCVTCRRVDDTVCTCDPDVHWTRSVESQPRRSIGYYAIWWIARLGSRRRTRQAAIRLRELHGSKERRISEWESPQQLPRAMGNLEN